MIISPIGQFTDEQHSIQAIYRNLMTVNSLTPSFVLIAALCLICFHFNTFTTFLKFHVHNNNTMISALWLINIFFSLAFFYSALNYSSQVTLPRSALLSQYYHAYWLITVSYYATMNKKLPQNGIWLGLGLQISDTKLLVNVNERTLSWQHAELYIRR